MLTWCLLKCISFFSQQRRLWKFNPGNFLSILHIHHMSLSYHLCFQMRNFPSYFCHEFPMEQQCSEYVLKTPWFARRPSQGSSTIYLHKVDLSPNILPLNSRNREDYPSVFCWNTKEILKLLADIFLVFLIW